MSIGPQGKKSEVKIIVLWIAILRSWQSACMKLHSWIEAQADLELSTLSLPPLLKGNQVCIPRHSWLPLFHPKTIKVFSHYLLPPWIPAGLFLATELGSPGIEEASFCDVHKALSAPVPPAPWSVSSLSGKRACWGIQPL